MQPKLKDRLIRERNFRKELQRATLTTFYPQNHKTTNERPMAKIKASGELGRVVHHDAR